MKNVYGYIRVSTVKQADGVSLEVQKRDIIQFAQIKNLNIVEWFEEQKSASKGFRPKFNQMIEQLYAKKADGFVAHKIDRMMRNRHDWAIINELIDEGCEVLSADGTTLDDVNGRFMGDIQAAVATRYSHNLAQEAKKGLYGRLAQGIMPFRAPIGYVNHGKGKDKTLDPVKAPLVKELFDLYVHKGYSVAQLIDEMYRRGLRNLFENKVTKTGIITILRNPFYTGIIEIKGQQFKGNHPPLISVQTFKKAQEILKGKANAQVFKHDFLFRKMIACQNCGYKLIGERQKGKIYYRCHTKECPVTTIRESAVDSYIHKMFSTISITDTERGFMENALKKRKNDWESTQQELLKSLNLKKVLLQTKQERITQLLIDGVLDNETYHAEKKKIMFELQQLEEQEVAINVQNLSYIENIAKYLEQANTLHLLYEKANVSEKRELIKNITSNLLSEGKNLIFSMVKPYHELSNRRIFMLCADNYTTLRQSSYFLVLGDQEHEAVPESLDEQGCKNFITYLLNQHLQLPIKTVSS